MIDNTALTFDLTVRNPARTWNALIGGKDNFEADRAAAYRAVQLCDVVATAARAAIDFEYRAVQLLAASRGIRQYIVIGCGFPRPHGGYEVNEVAQNIDPAARTLYIDNDTLVATHARALFVGSRPGTVGFLAGDLLEPDTILDGIRSGATEVLIDLAQPVAVVMTAVLDHVQQDPTDAVQTLIGALPPGSYVQLTHFTLDHLTGSDRADAEQACQELGWYPRTREQVSAVIAGLKLVGTDLVHTDAWRPLPSSRRPRPAAETMAWAAVARVSQRPAPEPVAEARPERSRGPAEASALLEGAREPLAKPLTNRACDDSKRRPGS